jgi:5-methylthioribose kinase
MSQGSTTFELTVATAPAWVDAHGLNPRGARLAAAELEGGVSASVVAVTGAGVAVVVKQARARLRVADVWEADLNRLESEVAALRLLYELMPGVVPRVLAHDPGAHVFAMELVPPEARNWQAEIGAQRVHPEVGGWAGSVLGTWHLCTSAAAEVEPPFDRFELFEQLRLRPFHETVIERRPELAGAIGPYLAELRSARRCLVAGDYAPKNMLVIPGGRRWALDFEVAHRGNPVFDLGFFLSFLVLSAVRWPRLTGELRDAAAGFTAGYADAAGAGFAGDDASIVGHTACLVLARTDGMSPAQFLDPPARDRARAVGVGLLAHPERGLWSWV